VTNLLRALAILHLAMLAACAGEPKADVETATPPPAATITVLASGTATTEPTEVPGRCGLALDPIPELLEGTRVAAARWSAATGCDVRVEAGGVPVRFATNEEVTGEDGELGRGVTSFDKATAELVFIGYRSGPVLPWTVDMTLTHELGHALGCHSHTSDGGVLDTPSQLYSKITADALTCTCASLACEVMVPEA
jgi:hypothetical protein